MLCALLCALFAARHPRLLHPEVSSSPALQQKAASARRQDGSAFSIQDYLFPDLDPGAVTGVSVITPDSRFEFRFSAAGGASVNGREADEEACQTLVSQIGELPVAAQDAFTPTDAPLLTLIVSSGGTQHAARFYAGSADPSDVRIVSGAENAQRYRSTDGWRIGTLLMACEGTRIQDERGNETPAY